MDDPQERKEFGLQAQLLLGGIGVYGPPVSPSSTIDEILEGSEPALLSGSLQPMTLRVMASLLIQNLDPEEKVFFIQRLIETAQAANQPDLPREEVRQVIAEAIQQMNATALPGFNAFADKPLFFMHLGASLSAIEDDALDQAKRWKKRMGIGEPPRIRKKIYAEYLKVWDLREGWTEGGYDRRNELKLREIAKRLGEPISTISSRYKQAFRLVVGVDFSPELWFEVFGPLKLHDLFRSGAGNKRSGVKRRIQKASHRPVPESKLVVKPKASQPNNILSRPTLVDSIPTPSENYGILEKLNDFRLMIANGRTDQRISSELDMDLEQVKNLRDHLEEFKDY
jgi:hypothetical protein